MHLLQLRPWRQVHRSAPTGSPSYAILSHTWDVADEEVSFDDISTRRDKQRAGFRKLLFCGEQAEKDGLRYFWVDSCCIDKANNTELTEAIISMFRWYQNAARCYVYLSDVSNPETFLGDRQQWESTFRNSRWFTRGWTLQELLAPRSVEFFSKEGVRLGDKSSLEQLICEVTKIPPEALRGATMTDFGTDERFAWASQRETTREEDRAYCLQGLFGVFVAPMYGEGQEHAQYRLREAIENRMKKRKMNKADQHYLQSPKRTYLALSELGAKSANTDFSDTERKLLLKSLQFEQMEARHTNIKLGHAKTCRWLVEHRAYRSWLDINGHAHHAGFFWIKGKPGCGKSTLMKFLLAELKKSFPKMLFLSFFFNARGEQLERNTLGLYRSLLFQLLEKFTDSDRIWDQIASDLRLSRDQMWTNVENLKALFHQAIRLAKFGETTITVDALDECNDDEVRDMVAFFEKLGDNVVDERGTIRILFSSRHYPHITVRKSTSLIVEDELGHVEDIDKYLDIELKAGRTQQAEKLRKEIQTKASGVFLWVVLVVQILNKLHDAGHAHLMRKRLAELPADLGDLFRGILVRDSENLAYMRLCLQWVLFASRPLTREELYFAILSGAEPEELGPWDPGSICSETMELFILSSSKGLAKITRSERPTVQFIHESVRDFLLKAGGLRQVLGDLGENPIGSVHDELRRCCETYIKSDGITEELRHIRLPKVYLLKGTKLLAKESPLFPFLEYSVRNLLIHANCAHSKGIDQTTFLQQLELSRWVRLHNFIEEHDTQCYPQNISLAYILAHMNYASLIRPAVRNGQLTRTQCGRYGNPLFAAIANENQEAFEELLTVDRENLGCGVDFPYHSERPLLFLLNYASRNVTEQCLSSYNFTVDVEKDKGILVKAAQMGRCELVEWLIDKGADVNAQGEEYDNALQAASYWGHEQIVQILLDRGADVNAQGAKYGTALQAASARGHKQIAQVVINRGADVNAQGGYNGTALQVASAKGHEKVVQILLDRGADVNAQRRGFDTALQAASAMGHENVVQILLESGANVNAQGGINGTALQVASAGGHEQIVQMLLDMGADATAQAVYGATLQVASARGHEKVVQILLNRGADVNARGGYYDTALQAASAEGYKDIVQILLDRGADVNAQGGKYGTALQAASAMGHKQIVQILCQLGAQQ